MTGHLSERARWAIVMAFAIAMALVEAASVFYLRALVNRIEPYQADPLVMILWGTLVTQAGDDATDARWTWALGWIGIVLALAIFMIDAWRALPDGRDAVRQVLPTRFNWSLFWVALLLMASPALHQVAF